MILIGLSGHKTAGKDTVFELMGEIAGCDVARAAFGDKVKVMAAVGLAFQGDEETLILHMDDFKNSGKLVRTHFWTGQWLGESEPEEFLERYVLHGRGYVQRVGDGVREVFGQDFWINQILPHASTHPSRDVREVTNRQLLQETFGDALWAVVTDVRYPNEAKRVRDLGGLIWEVVRPGLEPDGHPSEEPLPRNLVDHIIHNDQGINELRQKVRSKMEESDAYH